MKELRYPPSLILKLGRLGSSVIFGLIFGIIAAVILWNLFDDADNQIRWFKTSFCSYAIFMFTRDWALRKLKPHFYDDEL
jgi:hypothetical protein